MSDRTAAGLETLSMLKFEERAAAREMFGIGLRVAGRDNSNLIPI